MILQEAVLQKVNLFFVGTAKSSTTSLYQTLMDYCDFNLPIVKEPNCFNTGCSQVPGKGPGDQYATEVIRDLGKYEENYKSNLHVKYKCDFSVSYLYDNSAPDLIKNYNPEAKVVVILRNPIDRAWSHYLHLVRDCREQLTFEEALKNENKRILDCYEFSWHYFNLGLYSTQVARYKEIFRERVKFFIYEEILKDNERFFKELSSFLDIPALQDATFSKQRFNSTGSVKRPFIAAIVNKPSYLRSMLRALVPRGFGSKLMESVRKFTMDDKKPTIPDDVKSSLAEAYSKDIVEVEKLLNIDLAFWKVK